MKIFIYKLSDKDGKIYFGSTKEPKKRLGAHLNNAIYDLACSSKRLNHLEWKMEILQEFDDKKDAESREGELILNNECVNINVPGQSKKARSQRSWKKWQEKNYKRIDCACGGRYSQHPSWSHFRTKKHIEFFDNLTNDDMFEVDGV